MRPVAMFLKVRHDKEDTSLMEVLDLKELFDPFATNVHGRLHAGEEMQDAKTFFKGDLFFPSGEALPRCWLDSHYQA
jgi:hypothetical protein